MKRLLQILFFSSTLALFGGGDPAKFNNYPRAQAPQNRPSREELNRRKAQEIRRRRVEEAAEEERIVREYEAEKAAEEQAAAEERSREAGEEELNKEAAQWKDIYEIEAQAAAEKRSRDAYEQEKKDLEYADALEAQAAAEKLDEKIRISREAAVERSRIRKHSLPDTDKESLKRPHSQALQEPPVASEGPRPTWPQALFTEKDSNPIQDRLIELIKKEKKSIRVAMYSFTNEIVADVLANQSNKGVRVTVLVDGNYNKVKNTKKSSLICFNILKKNGVSIRIFPSSLDKFMHHKFLLFDDNNGDSLLWNGSYNISKKANKSDENVTITNDLAIIASFSQEFEKLWEQGKDFGETQLPS